MFPLWIQRVPLKLRPYCTTGNARECPGAAHLAEGLVSESMNILAFPLLEAKAQNGDRAGASPPIGGV